MPEVNKHICLVAIGPDRERLAADLIGAIAQRGCTVTECRIAPLGAHFSAVMMLSGNWSVMARTESALPGIAEQLGLTIHHVHGRQDNRASDFRPYTAEIIAPQQPQLLGELLSFFDQQGVRVVEINTQSYDSTFTGANMCNIHLALHVPMTQHPQTLRDTFMDLCDELHADGLLDPVKT